jgi:hypothetical protein
MTTRRSFLKLTALAGTGMYLARKLDLWPRVFGQVPGGTLPPTDIPKFAMPLTIPAAMPLSGRDNATDYNQRATALWYHDHTLGMTRLNMYAGPPGFT